MDTEIDRKYNADQQNGTASVHVVRHNIKQTINKHRDDPSITKNKL